MTYATSGLALSPTLVNTSTPWSNRYEIFLTASQGQSMQYLDAVVSKLSVELDADLLRIDDVDLEYIVGEDVEKLSM